MPLLNIISILSISRRFVICLKYFDLINPSLSMKQNDTLSYTAQKIWHIYSSRRECISWELINVSCCTILPSMGLRDRAIGVKFCTARRPEKNQKRKKKNHRQWCKYERLEAKRCSKTWLFMVNHEHIHSANSQPRILTAKWW